MAISPKERAARAKRLKAMAAAVWTKPQFGDGCSYSPDVIILRSGAVSVVECCETHDKAYSKGGGHRDRHAADRQLHECLRCRIGRWRASVYYAGVRLFGRFSWNG